MSKAGPSAGDIAAEDQAAAEQAQSQANLISEEQNVEKQRAANAALTAAQNQANQSSLLAEGNQIEVAGAAADMKNNKPANPTTNAPIVGNVLTAPVKAAVTSAPKGVGG